MSELEKAYHWGNLVLNPILLLAVFIPGVPEPVMGIAMGWALLSAILNEQLRRWVLGAMGTLTGGIFWIACVGSLVGVVVFAVVATIAILAGFIVILPLLWGLSLKAIMNERRGLI